MQTPQVGKVLDGHRFKGGDPADQKNWEPVISKGDIVDGYRFKGGDPAEQTNWEEYAPAATSTVEQTDEGPQLKVEAPSWGDVATGAYENFPSSAAKYAGGIVEAITHPGATLQGVADIAAGGLRKALPKDVVNFIDMFDTNPEATKRATEVFKQVGGEYAKNYGTVEGFKRHLMTDPVSVMADLSMVSGAGAGVAKKAGAPERAVNALTRTAELTNPLHPLGVAWDKTLKVGKRAGEGISDFIRSFRDQKGHMYERGAAGRENEIINALEAYRSPIPGYKPTAADVAADVAGPEFAALGRSAERGPMRGEFYDREMANQAALGEALNRMAFKPTAGQRTPVEQMAEKSVQIRRQEALRSATARENYGAALEGKAVPGDENLSILLQRPSMDRAMEHARQIAREKGQDSQLGTIEARRTPINVVDARGNVIGKHEITENFAEYTGTGLHYLKMALDDMIKKPEEFGIKGAEVAAIANTRRMFIDWMEQKLPGYEKARSVFADQSKPINQMQVAKYLSEKLTPAIGEGAANLRASSFATAVQDAPTTIKRATDSTQRYGSVMEILTPGQVKVVEDVLTELQKKSAAERKAGLAKGPEFDITQSTKITPGEHLSPSFLSSVVTTANHIWRKLRGKIDQQVAVEISRELLDPKKAAEALSKVKIAKDIREFKKRPVPQSRGMTAVDNAILRAFKSPVSPQLMNALNAGREQQESNFDY